MINYSGIVNFILKIQRVEEVGNMAEKLSRDYARQLGRGEDSLKDVSG